MYSLHGVALIVRKGYSAVDVALGKQTLERMPDSCRLNANALHLGSLMCAMAGTKPI